MQVCFITGQDYMPGQWSLPVLCTVVNIHVCGTILTAYIQSWNWLQTAVVNNVYCKSHDFMDVTNIQLCMESSAQHLDLVQMTLS